VIRDQLSARLGRRRLLASLGLWLAGEAHAEPWAPGSSVEWPALTLLDGTTLGPGAWSDTAAVVVFWDISCPYCRRHNGRLQKLHRATQGQPLRALAVALDRDESAVAGYMAANGFEFPVLVGGADLRSRFTRRLVIPMTCLVDRRGRLLQVIPGEMAEDDVLALAALARPPGA
jgi:hypothetical protein